MCDLIVKSIVISPGDAFDKKKVNDTRGYSALVITRQIVNKTLTKDTLSRPLGTRYAAFFVSEKYDISFKCRSLSM